MRAHLQRSAAECIRRRGRHSTARMSAFWPDAPAAHTTGGGGGAQPEPPPIADDAAAAAKHPRVRARTKEPTRCVSKCAHMHRLQAGYGHTISVDQAMLVNCILQQALPHLSAIDKPLTSNTTVATDTVLKPQRSQDVSGKHRSDRKTFVYRARSEVVFLAVDRRWLRSTRAAGICWVARKHYTGAQNDKCCKTHHASTKGCRVDRQRLSDLK